MALNFNITCRSSLNILDNEISFIHYKIIFCTSFNYLSLDGNNNYSLDILYSLEIWLTLCFQTIFPVFGLELTSQSK